MTVDYFGPFIRIAFKANEHYFSTAFEPILVTGEDGKEYPVIPSDQFK